MLKDFDKWNTQKKELDIRKEEFFFKDGEIWWCSVGVNIGSESCGKGETFRRPVLVLRKLSSTAFIGIPFLRSQKSVRGLSAFWLIVLLNVCCYIKLECLM